jgi:hypothetical protein
MNELLETPGISDGVPDVDMETQPAAPRPKLPPIKNAAQLLADDKIKLPPEIIENVLHQGLKGIIGSSSKARKTWILLDVALSVSTGKPFWKWNTKKGRVLYINFEIPEAFIKSRIKRLAEAKAITDTSNLDVQTLRGHAAPFNTLLPELLAMIKSGTYSLIIIDPVYKGLGGRDENSAGDISELCNELERLAVATGAAIVFAAHYSKGNQAAKEAMDRIGGSGVFARDADSIITLTKHETEGAFTVDLILRNLPEQPPFVVVWEFPVMKISPDLDPEALKKPSGGRHKAHDPQELVAAIAKSTKKKPVSISAWAKTLGIPRQTLSEYLPGLRAKGWIATAGEGSAARQYLTAKGQEAARRHLGK